MKAMDDTPTPLGSPLEQAFARSLGVSHAVGFAYARHGLTGILTALGARPGDQVVLSPLTCKVVPLALLSLELEPVYADISERTLNLAPDTVEAALGERTRAVLFQHTYGQPAGIREVLARAAARGVPLIEDCAQCMPRASGAPSPGATGTAAVFSNNLRKPLPAGSGALAVTSDAGLAAELRARRDRMPQRGALATLMLRAEVLAHRWLLGPRMYWPLYELSRNLRFFYKHASVEKEIRGDITDAAVRTGTYQQRLGRRWLAELDRLVDQRRGICGEYSEALAGMTDIERPIEDLSRPLYYYPVFVERKQELLRRARRRSIELVAWPINTPIYPIEDESLLPAYGYRPGSCPTAEAVAGKLVGLPTDHATAPRHRRAVVDLLARHHGG
jgi:dTDP-4-amino-4,6-dideoxygalactose transaminase